MPLPQHRRWRLPRNCRQERCVALLHQPKLPSVHFLRQQECHNVVDSHRKPKRTHSQSTPSNVAVGGEARLEARITVDHAESATAQIPRTHIVNNESSVQGRHGVPGEKQNRTMRTGVWPGVCGCVCVVPGVPSMCTRLHSRMRANSRSPHGHVHSVGKNAVAGGLARR